MNKVKLAQLEKLKWKNSKKGKKEEQGKHNYNDRKMEWFAIGSFRRIGMVFLSYALILVFLCSSFFVGAYSYWFGGETADAYEETELFQEQMRLRIKKTVPALEHYFWQEERDNNEMVKIYTLVTEYNGDGKKEGYWKETKSYTCESAAKIAGFQTDLKDSEWGPQVYYQSRNDQFLYDFPDTHFVQRWESLYSGRSNDGVQKYCAVDGEELKEWILSYGIENGTKELYLEIPEDVYYLEWSGGSDEELTTILGYSEKRNRWYYLTTGYKNKKKAFYMPDTVYFPLYSTAEEQGQKKNLLTEFSDGLSGANFYLVNGIMYSRMGNGKSPVSEEDMLKESPFFNLKTILYEAGKEYYHQKALLCYIDNKMGGYLWRFTFHTENGKDTVVGSEISYGSDMKNWEFSVNYDSAASVKEEFQPLVGVGEQQGYDSVTVELALPKYSAGSLLSALMDGTITKYIRYCLQENVFEQGHKNGKGWAIIAVLSIAGWLYLMVRLLFGKGRKSENAIFAEASEEADGFSEQKSSLSQKELQSVSLSRFDRMSTEISIMIICGIILSVLYISMDVVLSRRWTYGIYIFTLFFDCTLVYFLCYAGLVSLIRRIRAGILWKNLLIVKAVKWIWNQCSNCFYAIWNSSGCKRKMILLTAGYIMGSIFCGVAVMVSLLSEEDEMLILCIVMMILFWVLQGKAIIYVNGNETGKERLLTGLKELSQGNLEYQMDTRKLSGKYLEMAETLPKIRDGLNKAIQRSLRNERMKTELITNVSHDIKTPLTSIINYVDLLKRAKPQGENVEHYLEVLAQKSERLKHLIEDLVEASKASSGTLPLEKTNLDLIELIQQVMGEFEEKLSMRNLLVLVNYPEPPVTIFADGQRMFRIMENLFQNVCKYAMEGTRVYLDLEEVTVTEGIELSRGGFSDTDSFPEKNTQERKAVLTLRNISAAPLNISEEELTERFVRGEESRTTEGSGLGLSIAKDLVRLQGGEFYLKIDGDLFKVVIEFSIVESGSGIPMSSKRISNSL